MIIFDYKINLYMIEVLEETFQQGQLDEKEFKTIKKSIDNLLFNLTDTNEKWVYYRLYKLF